MAQTRIHGKNFKVYIDPSTAANAMASPVLYLNAATLDQNTDQVEVTSSGDLNKVFVSGLPGAQGTLAGFVGMGTTTFSAIGDGQTRKMYLYPDATNFATSYFFTTANFSSSYDLSSADAFKVSMSWTAASQLVWQVGP